MQPKQKYRGGRPLGRRNTELKLDKHAEVIKKYLIAGICMSDIAKILNCHRQTVYAWVAENLNREELQRN